MNLFDHPIVIFIIIAVSLVRWLAQKKAAAEEPDPERPHIPNQPIPRSGETHTEEERIRRFLEALGQPTTSTPPPKATRRVVVPKRTMVPHVGPFTSPLPPLTTTPPLPVTPPPPVPTFETQTTEVQPPPPPPIEPPVFKPATPSETRFEVRELGAHPMSDPASLDHRVTAEQRGLLLKLASTQDLRRAIILREIFGPPRGLQSASPINSF